MSGFEDIAGVAAEIDRALGGDYQGMFCRGDCEIIYFQEGIGPDVLVERDDLLSFGAHGNA